MNPSTPHTLTAADLPVGSAPAPVASPHFPNRLHAYVWRNWQLVPPERLARVVGAAAEDILAVGRSMGLTAPPPISPDQLRRSHITIIRRNWHLLPYEQLLDLLEWTPDEMAYTLQEDDFLYIKLGRLKPYCEPLRYTPPDASATARAAEIAGIVREAFPEPDRLQEPLFAFVDELSRPPAGETREPRASRFSPRYCYSYFALYGDPLLDTDLDPYPDGYLARLAACGVDGVWLQAVLYKLAPFPWQPELSDGYEQRLENLRALVERARRQGIGIHLYLNEPRSMPLAFFATRPELQGAVQGDYAALCSSHPDVQAYLRDAVAGICRAAPDLAGLFTITASENFTNCWSHHRGEGCPRCGRRPAAEVIAEVNTVIRDGIRQAGSHAEFRAWDWGWQDEDAGAIIRQLPTDVALMSVSEWSIPIQRGGVESIVGEYSLSTVGPGPRATRHWGFASERGMKTVAKIQAANTWELSAVPYIPAVENSAQHIANLRAAGVEGLMLGWTLGGYPSPNLEVVGEMGGTEDLTPQTAMERVARRRYGAAASAVVRAWQTWSAAFREFPYHIGTVYRAPLQMGPANPLWEAPTGYSSTMVGIPYDDLTGWRQVYPPEVFIAQFDAMAVGFELGCRQLEGVSYSLDLSDAERGALAGELAVAEAVALHFRSVANQCRFIVARDALAAADAEQRADLCDEIEDVLQSEIDVATRLHAIQARDSRIGFEATNQYYYVPLDLVEKVLICRDLLDRWLPAQRGD